MTNERKFKILDSLEKKYYHRRAKTTLKAIELSLSKYIALEKNNISVDFLIINGRSRIIRAYYCPLCELFLRGVTCGSCPLKPRNRAGGCRNNSAWGKTYETKNYKYIIKALEKALAREKNKCAT